MRAPARFGLRRLPHPIRAYYQNFLSMARMAPRAIAQVYGTKKRIASIDAAYGATRSFNAWARSHGTRHTITISCALPCILHFCFNNVLRLPLVWPRLGDPRQEVPYRTFGNGIPLALPSGVALPVMLQRLPSLSRPRDDKRALVASGLAELATAFCVFHEVAHIVAGHTRHLAVLPGASQLRELAFESTNADSKAQLRRVWEFEADLVGAALLANLVLSAHDHYREAFDLGTGPDHRYEVLASALFAVGVLFFLMGQSSSRLESASFHPHPYVRLGAVRQAMFGNATHPAGGGLDANRLRLLFERSSKLAARASLEVGLQVPALRRLRAPASSIDRQHRLLIASTVKLRPEYQRWSFFPGSNWIAADDVY